MPLLFSYGTLQQDNVQIKTFGRLLHGWQDELLGYSLSMVQITDPDVIAASGKDHHPIVSFTGNNDDRVTGTVFDITEEELANADRYEVADYVRVLAPLASGKNTWVYVASKQTQFATLAGGCFWCLEAVFDQLQGVISVESGYSGGRFANPSYPLVCTGTSGHAEVVRIVFDSAQVSYAELLQVFFSIHDPTTKNRQGADVGSQYRSAIFYHDESQCVIAIEVIRSLESEGVWANPIVTEVSPLVNYYPAESYHQEYFANNQNQSYCTAVVAPKVVKFRQKFISRLKKT